MKKIILSFAAICVCLASLVSCSSVDLDPTNRYDKSYAFRNMENANLYLDYFYQIDGLWGSFGACALGGSNANMSDGLTDILKYGGIVAGVGDCNLIMTVSGQQSVSTNYFDSWTTGYGWIRRINEFLQGLDEYKNNFSEEQYKQLRAEALFYRGQVKFYILRSHGSVKDDLGYIIYDSLASMSAETKDQKRANLADSWANVKSDLDEAMAGLPEPGAAAGRVHKYAACAMMARAMLYAGRYDDALAAAQTVVDSGLYGYMDDYDAIFASLENEEVIWGRAYLSGTMTHSFDAKYSMPGDYCDNGGKGGGQAGPTQEFVDMFDNADGTPFDISNSAKRFITNANVGDRDPRLAASVLYNGAVWKGRALECYEGGVDQKYMPFGSVNTPGNTVTGYYMRKLLDESNTAFDVNGSYQCWPAFRYAELRLIMAECLAYKKDYASAREIVSELRQHRFGSATVATGAITSWDSALDVILHERAIELCYEGHRFWDLRRTGRAKSVLDGKKYSGVLWTKSGSSFTPQSVSADMGAHIYPDRFDRFPIPQTETSNNKLADQNSDW